MKSPKLLLLGGAALLTATVVVAQLTPEQRKAAEDALRQKISEMNAADAAAKSAPKSKVVVKDSTKGQEGSKGLTADQEAKARGALNQSYATGSSLSPEKEAQARAALNQSYASGSSLPADKEAKARAALNEAYAKADKSLSPEQEAKARAALGEAYAKADKSLSPEQEAMAREALMAKNAELDKQERMAAAQKPGPDAKPAVAKAIPTTGKYLKPDDIALSQEQWNQLVDLTDSYKADQIGASEYHAKRSEIISSGGAQ